MATNYELLTDVRVYLREQVRGMAPNNELVDSWDDFFTTYDAIIRKFAAASGVRRWEVDECVQEVWSAVVAQLEDFEIDPNRGSGQFRTWLYRIVRTSASKVVRERIQSLALSSEGASAESDSAESGPQGPAKEQNRSAQS